MIYHEGVYYLYLLSNETLGYHDSLSVATSTDGVHYKDHGVIIRKDKYAQWLGSGQVWKSPDFENDGKFIMNYSKWYGPSRTTGQQTIFFAVSTDLIHWTELGLEYEFRPDTRWYDVLKGQNSRWDCIYHVDRAGGGYYGYWTANPLEFTGFGFGQSLDGIHWESLAPPVIDWDGRKDQMIEGLGETVGEMFGDISPGAVEKIKGKYLEKLTNNESFIKNKCLNKNGE